MGFRSLRKLLRFRCLDLENGLEQLTKFYDSDLNIMRPIGDSRLEVLDMMLII